MVRHPNYGSHGKRIYASFLELCEDTLELATQYVERKLEPIVKEAVCELADEMLETAEPFEPTEEQIAEHRGPNKSAW